ncbi:BtrH N-terminal domain-containing protein [Kibdelosporangium philippinense]|uniref:BtrH N-terminal domain-containing protein n=1 Tax=Kibdelosporangium philippinense TaxID=211113 RepID=UPI003609FBE5
MTSRKQLKAQVRARMAKTGERYTTALAHVAGASPAGGWTLRGGTDPDAAGLHAMLTARGISGLTEALVFGIGGGIGAGYILWEFKHDNSRYVTIGFDNSWQYFGRRTEKVLTRLGIAAEWHRSAPKPESTDRPCVDLPGVLVMCGSWVLVVGMVKRLACPACPREVSGRALAGGW